MIDFLVNLALFIYQQIVNQDFLYFGKFLIKKIDPKFTFNCSSLQYLLTPLI